MIETHKFLPLAGILVLVLLFIIACNRPKNNKPVVRINTSMGEIDIELYPDKAPRTVAAFLKNVKEDIYLNSNFYRVLKADPLPSDYNSGLIQGGVYKTSPVPEVAAIPHEPTNITGLSHTNGTISLARTEPGTASSEFFICIGDQSSLDAGSGGTPDSLGFAAFGKVIKGMTIVKKIQNQPSQGDAFEQPVKIENIKIN